VVLSDVDLVIEPGLHVAVVGETGSGKTTLARLLTRLMDPVRGRITLDGVDLRDVRFSSLRRSVVLVPQEGFLVDGTLLDNLRWGADDLTEEQAHAAITGLGLDTWFDGLPRGLDTPVGPRGEALSAGERQLVAIIRTSLRDPDLLVLDEATSSVDPSTESVVQNALVRLSRGRTAVTIAHRLSTAEAADLVVVVENGRIADAAPHAVLLQRCAPYQRLHASWRSHLAA
jgi:putative ABC transport system ATP-binding protein